MSVAYTAAPPRVRTISYAGLLVVALGSLDIGLEQSLVLPALPALARHYESSLIATSWIVTGFLLSTVVATPLLGRLGDMFGRRRLLFIALGAFTAGGLVCALSGSIGLVIAGRILQGFGSATGALMLGILRESMPGERLTRSIGLVIGGVSAGGPIGSVLSGLLVDHVSARSVFWFLTVLSLALMLGALAFLPETPRLESIRVDVVGAAFLAGALVAKRPFANANVCALAAGYSFFVVLIVVPQIAAMPTLSGYGFGYSTTRTGLLLVPMAVVALISAWVAGAIIDI